MYLIFASGKQGHPAPFLRKKNLLLLLTNIYQVFTMQRIQFLVKGYKYKNPPPRGTAKRELRNHSLRPSIYKSRSQGLISYVKSQSLSMVEPRWGPRSLNFSSRILHLSCQNYAMRPFPEECTNAPWEVISGKLPTFHFSIGIFSYRHALLS